MDTTQKLSLLADASRYDLSCACGTKSGVDHRKRGADGLWLYPVSLPRGGVSIMLKTLLSNVCVNDCRYCPFRNTRDIPRTTLSPDEVAATYIQYVQQAGLCGLFLSSGVIRSADHTMDRMTAVAEILRRKYEYQGFIHLKVIPGSSDAAIEQALSLSNAVSLNIEVPRRSAFSLLSSTKDFDRDIVTPMKRISELTAPGMPYERVKKITQFIVGAADEIDADIIQTTWRLYKKLHYNRVYFSAYQRGLGDPSLPGEQGVLSKSSFRVVPIAGSTSSDSSDKSDMFDLSFPSAQTAPLNNQDLLTREHRLYQVDWLIRRYHFSAAEIPFEPDGNLSLTADPKEIWAKSHPEFFPIAINRAGRFSLLRVPGLGEIMVQRILNHRNAGNRIRSLDEIGRLNKRLLKAKEYLRFD